MYRCERGCSARWISSRLCTVAEPTLVMSTMSSSSRYAGVGGVDGGNVGDVVVVEEGATSAFVDGDAGGGEEAR